MKKKNGSRGAVMLDDLLYPWEKIRDYERFTLWKHLMACGTYRYECFDHDVNPNDMKMTSHGVMQYPLEEV